MVHICCHFDNDDCNVPIGSKKGTEEWTLLHINTVTFTKSLSAGNALCAGLFHHVDISSSYLVNSSVTGKDIHTDIDASSFFCPSARVLQCIHIPTAKIFETRTHYAQCSKAISRFQNSCGSKRKVQIRQHGHDARAGDDVGQDREYDLDFHSLDDTEQEGFFARMSKRLSKRNSERQVKEDIIDEEVISEKVKVEEGELASR